MKRNEVLQIILEFQLFVENNYFYFSSETLRALHVLAKDMQHELLSEKGEKK